MTKVSKFVGAGGLLAFAAGCNLLPPELQPPTTNINAQPPKVDDLADMMSLSVVVNVLGPGEDRAIQYNGGTGALQTDISHLIVGIFDYGGTTVPSFGYIYTGAVNGATAAAITATTAGAGGTHAFMSGTTGGSIKGKIGTVNCSGCSFGTVPSANANNDMRRYLVRNYQTGSTWTSGSTTAKFTNIPIADSGGLHKYLVFAAAYDGHAPGGTFTPTLLGYAEALVKNATPADLPLTTGSDVPLTGSLALDLKLNEGLLLSTKAMTEAPSLSVYVPVAAD